jgi:hypothetical protein
MRGNARAERLARAPKGAWAGTLAAHARARVRAPSSPMRAAPSRRATAARCCRRASAAGALLTAGGGRRRTAGCNIVSRSRGADADAASLAAWREEALSAEDSTPVYGARAGSA